MNFYISRFGLIIIVLLSQLSYGQDLSFSWTDIGTGGGVVRSLVEVDSNLFYSAQMPEKNTAMVLSMIEYDQETGELRSEKITNWGKKQLVTLGQAQSFRPFTIGDKIFTFDAKAKKYEVRLIERGRMTMDILGDPIVLADYSNVKGEKSLNTIVFENKDEFTLIDGPWYFPWISKKKNQSKIKVFVFDSNSKKLKYDHQIELPSDVDKITILSREFDQFGNVWIFGSTSSSVKNDQYNRENLSHEYFVWKVNASGVELFRRKIEAQMLKANLQVSDGKVQIRSLISDDKNGLAIALFSLEDGEIEKTDSHSFVPSELFVGNESKEAARFKNNFTEAEKLRYGFHYLDHHEIKDGGGIEVMNLSFYIIGNDRVFGTMVYRYNKSGEIIWKRCFPAQEIIFSWIGSSGEVNVLINDASSRYEGGVFSGYSQEKMRAPQSPVHLIIDVNGKIVIREVIVDGMENGELFAPNSVIPIYDNMFLIGKKQALGSTNGTVLFGTMKVE